MEELLKEYLKSKFDLSYVKIAYYDILEASCVVHYYMDETDHYRDEKTVNIWDMLSFLNEKVSNEIRTQK